MTHVTLKTAAYRLARLAILSSFALVIALAQVPGAARAHEVRPAIADIDIGPDRAELAIELTLESMVAGLDLTELDDTNAAPDAHRYDTLRALPPEELADEFRRDWPEIRKGMTLRAGDRPLDLRLEAVAVGPVGNLELPRDSRLRLSAALPEDRSPVVFGWRSEYGAIVLRQVVDEGEGYVAYLTRGALSDPIPRSGTVERSWLRVFVGYVGLGFEHIVPKGLDHILFVLGLFFFSLKLRPILMQVTAFTLAHTVTLALGILGIVRLSPAIVEPLIAASIVYVAVENITSQRYRPWRTAVVFGFGLLHGLGFAAVLGDIGLDPARFVTGLLGFNIGVELGQLTVIGGAFLLVGLGFGRRIWYRRLISVPASAGIAAVGAIWFVQRITG